MGLLPGVLVKQPVCHCGEAGYFHCSELRAKYEEARKLIGLIIETDCLPHWAYERGVVDELSISEMCDEVMKWPTRCTS